MGDGGWGMGDGGWGMGGAWLIYFHVFQIEGSVNVEGEGGSFHIYDKHYV